jgi:protein involved in polysaccharide export with SLBB domain
MVRRLLSLAVVGALALTGCASSRTVRIQSSAAPSAAATDSAAASADEPLLPQDPMSGESETPMAADIVDEPPPAEEYVQLTSTKPSPLAPDDEATYLLDTSDRVRVFVTGQASLSRTYTVDRAGFISMPIIGWVKARGLTTDDLASTISTLLGADDAGDPEVIVEVASYRPIGAIGEAGNADSFAIEPGMTVEAAAAVAGGDSAGASPETFTNATSTVRR